ncbi:SDR family NAD(P)-dependent oxidoreductase [Myxococcota bacterium]|nr:SDR family NAD(P)-dependent oxidoreductase [Myxococcota bacterium]
MKILVTGASGLIGCHAVAALLEAGHAVAALARSPEKLETALRPLGCSLSDVEVAAGELEDREAIRRALAGRDGLLHCAGRFSPSRAEAEALHRTNVEGTRHVLEAAAEAAARGELRRAVHLSSMLALFPPRGPVLRAEDPVATPTSMYAITKARAEQIARELRARAPITIVYPAAVQGPNDPTFSIGPLNVAIALRERKALVTEGGLAYTDVRDLAALIVAIFAGRVAESGVMAPSFFVPHEAYRALLERITGNAIAAQKLPGRAMRFLGRLGDLAQRLGREVQLTYEAAEVLTRSVPLEDRVAREAIGRDPIPAEDSFRDLIGWMVEAGHLEPADAGKIGSARSSA